MAKGKSSSEIRMIPKIVEMETDALMGRDFTKGNKYHVLGMFRHTFNDKSYGIFYILMNDRQIVVDVEVSYFKVIDL